MSNTIKLRTNHADCPWITPGKIYEAEMIDKGKFEGLYRLKNPDFGEVLTGIENSSHLDGKSWEVVTE